MDSRPHLLAAELAVLPLLGCSKAKLVLFVDILPLVNPDAQLVEAVGHDGDNAGEVPDGSEATGWEVALHRNSSVSSELSCMMH